MNLQDYIRLVIGFGLGIMIGMTWLYGLAWGAPDSAFEQYAYGFWWMVGALVAIIGCVIWTIIIIYIFSSKK